MNEHDTPPLESVTDTLHDVRVEREEHLAKITEPRPARSCSSVTPPGSETEHADGTAAAWLDEIRQLNWGTVTTNDVITDIREHRDQDET